MIEVKKPGSSGLTLLTKTVDVLAAGADFTTLFSNPFKLISGIPHKIIVPINITVSYYSIGTQPNGFYICNENLTFAGSNSIFNFLQYGVVADQSGIITVQNWGSDVSIAANNTAGGGFNLLTSANIGSADYNKFIITLNYFLIDEI